MIMKKTLLIIALSFICLLVVSQSSQRLYSPVSAKYDMTQILAPEKVTPVTTVAPAKKFTPSGQTVSGREVTFIQIGESGNAFGFFGNPRTYLWADPPD
jgi:hypothetical protein